MAKPTTRTELKEYCLRRLGKPVLEINVDDTQLEDAIDYALSKFQEFGYDSMYRAFLKHKFTSAELTRLRETNDTITTADGTVYEEGQTYIQLPSDVISVQGIFDFGDKNAMSFFDVRYQIRLNDLYDFTSASFAHYYIIQQQLAQIDFLLVGKKPIRYTQTTDRLYIDMDFRQDTEVDKYIIIDCYKSIDPDNFPKVYQEPWLLDYTTALFKRQWGANLIKYDGVQLPGGVTLNGTKIYDDAVQTIEKLGEELRDHHELPPLDMIG